MEHREFHEKIAVVHLVNEADVHARFIDGRHQGEQTRRIYYTGFTANRMRERAPREWASQVTGNHLADRYSLADCIASAARGPDRTINVHHLLCSPLLSASSNRLIRSVFALEQSIRCLSGQFVRRQFGVGASRL